MIEAESEQYTIHVMNPNIHFNFFFILGDKNNKLTIC